MKNKRISSSGQRDILRVKIRTDEERRRRIFAAWSCLWKSVVLVVAGWGLWQGGREGWRCFVWENPHLLVEPPSVTTDGNLTRKNILEVAGIAEGRNILTVDLGKARAALESLPQVDRAEVFRTFPNIVTINVFERQPVAWVLAKRGDHPMRSASSLLIDARGIILRGRSHDSDSDPLPVISGVETGDLVPGQRAGRGEIIAALELLRLNADATRFRIRGIDLAKPCRLVVSDQRRGKITFGMQRIEEQFGRLNHILDHIEASQRELRTVNLVPEQNVAVTFYEAESEVAADVPTSAPPPPARAMEAPTPKPGAKSPKPEVVARPEKAALPPPQKTPVVKAERAPETPRAKPQAKSPARQPAPAERLRKRFTLDE